MTTIDATHTETIHVFAFDGTLQEAKALARDAAELGRRLGGVVITPGRAEAVDPVALAELGLSTYLVEGLGAAAGPVRADLRHLDRERRPAVILLPRAVRGSLRPEPPLEHLGSYVMERPTPAEDPLSSASAEPQPAAASPAPPRDPKLADRRASGVVAMAALGVALLVVVLVYLVAAA